LPLGGLHGSETETFDAGEDLIGGFCPAEGFGIVVDGVDVILDGLFELLRGAMVTSPQLLFSQKSEEAFDLVQP
jgi:hypothetical protein